MLNLLFVNRNNSSASVSASAMPMVKNQAAHPRNLAQAPAGRQVTINGFGKLSAQNKQHLQAYGLLPGRTVQVLAQRPVTIILVEQTELAFETEIAGQIFVD